MTSKALARRWTPQAVEGVISGWRKARLPLPFGPTPARWGDLRGIPVPDGIKLHGLRLRELDLSGARLRGCWLEDCVFEDCSFDDADLSRLADHGNEYRRCSFQKSRLRKAAVGYEGSQYLACRFVSAEFKAAVFVRGEFDDCEFVGCDVDGVDFNASSFVDCRFVGPLRDVWFRGGFALDSDAREFGTPRRNTMRNVSFKEAELHDVAFSNGCDLSTAELPECGDYRFYCSWRTRLERLREQSESWSSAATNEADVFVSSHLVHAETQHCYILNCDDVRREFGSGLGQALIDALDSLG